MKLLPLFISFAIGFAVCLWLTIRGCFTPKSEIQYVNTIEYKFRDTFILKEVPVYVPVVKTKTEIDSVLLEKFTEVYHVDSTFIDTSYNMVINTYGDTVVHSDYTMEYKIETLGYLTDFTTKIMTKRDSVVQTVTKLIKPKFCAQVGLSNLLQPKVGAGYKGWMLEAEFNNKLKFNQFFITKQFTF